MNSYQNVIDRYVEKMKEELKEELELLLIIGSSSSSKVIPGWSDIDVILVVSEYNFDLMEKIKKISNSYEVKIGTTVYSKKEFIEKNIDPKTYYHLYLLQNDKIRLQYKKSDIELPSITYDDIYATHYPYLLWRLHIYKRNFLYDKLKKEQIKGLYKTTYLIMKAMLIIDKELPRNYEEVFKLFSEKYHFDYYNYEEFIHNYQNDNEEYENIIEYAKKFLLFVMKRY